MAEYGCGRPAFRDTDRRVLPAEQFGVNAQIPVKVPKAHLLPIANRTAFDMPFQPYDLIRRQFAVRGQHQERLRLTAIVHKTSFNRAAARCTVSPTLDIPTPNTSAISR